MLSLRAALAGSLLLVACGKVDRVRECNRLARGVNPHLARVAAENAPKKRTSEAFETIAAQYESAADEVGRRHFDEHGLSDAAGEYGDVLERAGRACRQIARALPTNDRRAIDEAQSDLDKIVRKETMSVARVNASCNAP